MKVISKITKIKAFLMLLIALLFLGSQCPPVPEIKPAFENPHKNYTYYHKGQIHCHTMNSHDGKQSPYRVEEAYQRKGYIFICITDHNQATPDPEVLGILHITSGEDGDACRHHTLALGINFEKVKWYHDNVDSDRDSDQDGLDDRRTCPCGNIQPRVNYITQIQETIAVLAHPTSGHDESFLHLDCDEGWSLDDLKNTSNYTGIEVYNSGHWSTVWWDEVLSIGKHKRIWGFASDDCHNVEDNHRNFNRAWIVINSNKGPAREYWEGPNPRDRDELRQDIIKNIKKGNFYSVVRSPYITGESPSDGTTDIGPKLEITVLGGIVCVYTDQECERIRFYGGPSKILQTVRNTTDACYELKGSEDYVRIEVNQKRPHPDGELYTAFSQPLFVIK